jgi:subtilisin family serine protease
MLKRPILTLLSTAALTATAALSVPAIVVAAPASSEAKAAAKDKYTNNAYIVRLAEQPVTAYAGGIKGYPATKPRKGQKIDPNSAKVVKYKSYLESRHDDVLAQVGGSKKLYSYGYVFNGFAAELTDAQAEKLASMPGVLAVEKDTLLELDTSSTPDFIGLSGPGGFWETTGATGENVIIGIVDGGAWPEHPSFSDRTGLNGNETKGGKLGYQQIPGWHGKCTPGEEFTAANCNQKLIGARYYNAGWGGNAGIDAQLPWEFNSPRDLGGHGTHTATTAGGNANTATTGAAAAFGPISGIAPRARIAAYKVCWETGSGGSCFSSDSVAAIDQAVADGVDVINFSISGSRTNFRDSVEIAFLFAADAGVFVAASAGNSGPSSSTVAHPGPWLTTVAAGTHNRNGEGSVTLGNGMTYFGASVATAVGPASFIDSESAGLPGADPTLVRLCASTADTGGDPVLDPAKVAGKIVLCDRGVFARVNKSLAVAEAGGVGAVLVNNPTSSLNADFHFVPTVHVQFSDRDALKAYAATSNATATINQATIVYNTPAPFTASFSSRGPLLAGGGDLLKPDIIAPGQDILAGVAPPGNSGRLFDLYSGTSMSSPHVAGLAALFKELHPRWSPMAIKSALMTSAGDVLDGPNTNPLVIFRQGAGHVRPNFAKDPGLVFDSGFNDWLAFICSKQPEGLTGTCNALWNAGYPRDASDFNSPSIAIGDLGGIQEVKRTVKNVGATGTYTASVSGLNGFSVSITPASFTLKTGQEQELTLRFARTTASLNAYTGGQITWTDGTHNVRVPVVIRPVALGAPTQVSGSYSVLFGYDGPFTATARGMIPADVTAGTVDQDPDQTFDPADPTGTVAISVVIPAGSTYARFSLFDGDVVPGSDLDLFVYQGASLVGQSAAGGSDEEVNFAFSSPTAGPIALTVYVHGWGIVGGGSSPFKMHFWGLGTADEGNMTVSAPATAATGETGTIELSFDGLAAGTRYLGSVAYGGTVGMPAPTIVRVDTP